MEKFGDWPVKRVDAAGVARRRGLAEAVLAAPVQHDPLTCGKCGTGVRQENGGSYRAALAVGKRSVCGITDGSEHTLCGAPRVNGEGEPVLSLLGHTWLTVSDPEIVPDGYRPCADCVAAYKPAPSPGRKKVTWETKQDPATGQDVHRMVLVDTAEPITERLPENVDRHGSATRDAERSERLWARLGNVVPRLELDGAENGSYVVGPGSLWTVGSKSVHAGAEISGRLFLVCRDGVEKGKRAKADGEKRPTLTCGACRTLLYQGTGSVSRAMVAVAQRPAGADRFRPVKGVGERSADQRTRETNPLLAADESARSAGMLPGLGVMDGGKITPGYRKYEFAGREFALKGWVIEMLMAPVRDAAGVLLAADGWAFVRQNGGKMPDAIWRRMSREEKTACVRGMSFVRERQSRHRDIRRAREGREEKASAMRDFRYAVKNGDEREVRQGPVRNPYPRQGGVFDELRHKRES